MSQLQIVMLKYFLCWFPMLFIAILNGALREFVLKKFTNDSLAHQISTVTLLIFFVLYINFVVQKFPPSSSAEALWVGGFWVVLTLAFEFGFGRWRGNSWENLLSEYNLAKGKLWVLIPLWVAIAPYLFYRWFRA